ncbi:MAG: DUF1643 domain-containing protein [Chloroflexi bacterium]|nr:MAG: DUF1643 domain-containing protein [Chloroflexota bacterium]
MSGASFSRDRRYRYRLWRRWDAARPVVAFVMLNPSTADAARDDPTIRRCIGFARSWGYGRLEVVNLFAYRATDPRSLRHVPDPVGPANLRHLAAATARARLVIAAWGADPSANDAPARKRVLSRPELRCLGLTRSGAPRHPLYVPATARPRRVRPVRRSVG